MLHAVCFAYAGLHLGADSEGRNWELVGSSVLFLVLARGLWTAREWSRWACGVLGILCSAVLVVSIPCGVLLESYLGTRGTSWTDWIPWVTLLLIASLYGMVGLYCLRRSTRRAFIDARKSMVYASAPSA